MHAYKAVLFTPFEGSSVGVVCEDLQTAAEESDVALSIIEEQYLAEPVINGILRATEEADFAVAVLDEANPNVLFEIGYALGVNRPLILVSSEDVSIPFDVEAFERVQYNPRRKYRDENRRRFRTAFQAIRQRLETGCVKVFRDTPTHIRGALSRLQILNSPLLFRACVLHTLDEYVESIDAWQGKLHYEGRENVLRMGVLILENLRQSGFATLFLPGEDSWQADEDPKTGDEYLQVTREIAARKGIPITRVYVLPRADALDAPSLRRLVVDDAASGINTHYILENDLPAGVPKDFGLWDDELVGVVEYARRKGKHYISGTTYYYLDEDLRRARSWVKSLRNAPRCSGLPNEKTILGQTYRTQEDLANLRHERGFVDRADASWYHAGRQYLRLCDSVASPAWHRDFFGSSIRNWLESRDESFTAPRVLITGLADYGMLYEALDAVGPIWLKECSFEVLDLSSVPTDMCKELVRILQEDSGGKLYVNLTCHGGVDLLTRTLNEGQYDIILTDALLTRFESIQTKQAVVDEWHRLLKPDGLLATTVRLSDDREEASDEILNNMHSRFVQSSLQAWPSNLSQEDRLRLEAHAINYAQRMTSYPFEGIASVRELFCEGWNLESAVFEASLTKGEFCPATYVRIRITKSALSNA